MLQASVTGLTFKPSGIQNFVENSAPFYGFTTVCSVIKLNVTITSWYQKGTATKWLSSLYCFDGEIVV
jgi:hypothetical protein